MTRFNGEPENPKHQPNRARHEKLLEKKSYAIKGTSEDPVATRMVGAGTKTLLGGGRADFERWILRDVDLIEPTKLLQSNELEGKVYFAETYCSNTRFRFQTAREN